MCEGVEIIFVPPQDAPKAATGQLSAVETGQMSAAETEQMSAVKTRQMLKSQISPSSNGACPKPGQARLTKVPVGTKNIKFGPRHVENRRFGLKLGPNES